MSYFVLKAWTRGQIVGPLFITDAYNGMRNGSIEFRNFSKDAGLNESRFSWTRHTHEDGSLAPYCIKANHIRWQGTNLGVEAIRSGVPKMLMLFGSMPTGQILEENTVLTAKWADTSFTHESFLPGSTITAFLTYTRKGSGTTLRSLLTPVVISVDADGITYMLCGDEPNNVDGFVSYIAIGVPVGPVINPVGG